MSRIVVSVFVLTVFSGCMTNRRVAYIQEESKRKDLGREFVNEQKRALIQVFDELYVNVSSFTEDNPDMLSSGEVRMGGRTSTDYSLISYQVDEAGNIDLPLLGKTHVAGKTVDEVAKEIQEELKSYFYSPSVKISFVNKNITVIGMVSHPGRYFYSGENINVFQALGLAGDIEEYGNREKVIIVRENNGLIMKNTLDLTDKSIFISDFYYLKSGDVIYVEPLNRRVWGIDQVPFTLILSAITTSLLIFDYIKEN